MGKLKNKPARTGYIPPTASLNTNHGRVWKTVKADQVKEGDLVANLGQVIYTQTTYNNQVLIHAGYPQSREFYFPVDEELFAFVEKGD